MMRVPHLLVSAAVAASLLCVESAHATSNFPPFIQTNLVLAAPPDCSLCHNGGEGRRGNVTTPFGGSMVEHGLAPFDEAALKSALAAMESEKVDSDGDGVTDIAELKAGTDPNVGKAGTPAPLRPEYGCTISRIRPRSGGTPFALLFLAALPGFFRRTRQLK